MRLLVLLQIRRGPAEVIMHCEIRLATPYRCPMAEENGRFWERALVLAKAHSQIGKEIDGSLGIWQ